jgi:hypothetical protein
MAFQLICQQLVAEKLWIPVSQFTIDHALCVALHYFLKNFRHSFLFHWLKGPSIYPPCRSLLPVKASCFLIARVVLSLAVSQVYSFIFIRLEEPDFGTTRLSRTESGSATGFSGLFSHVRGSLSFLLPLATGRIY